MKFVSLLLISFLAALSTSYAQSTPPNIVIIFCDDLGYGDLGVYGHPTIQTPHLDKMASEGLKFTSFYSANAVCSASRASLLTGRYPPQHGTLGVYFHHHDTGLNPDEITLAEGLKEKGYATTCIGKWHLGHNKEFLPLAQGFDSYYGVPYSNDMAVDPEMPFANNARFLDGWTLDKVRSYDLENNKPPRNLVPLLEGNEVIEFPTDQTLLTQRYTEKAIEFIDENKNRPFFLYLAHTMPHIPLFASEKFLGKSLRGLYGDTIEEIDWSVGQILDHLKKKKLTDNTLVFFTSDNGPWLSVKLRGGSQGLLRGGKFTTWDGGQRVPAIAWWPGKIPPAVTSQLAATIDLFTTGLTLAGAAVPSDRTIEGLDISPLLFGTGPSPRTRFSFYRTTVLQAYREGPWKIHFKTQKETGGPSSDYLDPPLLFNVETDPSEQYDQAASFPEKVKQLSAQKGFPIETFVCTSLESFKTGEPICHELQRKEQRILGTRAHTPGKLPDVLL